MGGWGCPAEPYADRQWGARGLWGKPEARLWYFKRPEWLWSQLSINRCTQTRGKATITDERELDIENTDRLLQVCEEQTSPSSSSKL